MEAEEIPKAFTKPGPPIILPNELYATTQTKVMAVMTNKGDYYHPSSEANTTSVTEL